MSSCHLTKAKTYGLQGKERETNNVVIIMLKSKPNYKPKGKKTIMPMLKERKREYTSANFAFYLAL